jgi:hypothetical protein
MMQSAPAGKRACRGVLSVSEKNAEKRALKEER